MTDNTDSSWIDQPIDLPHGFMIEIQLLVTVNHGLVLQAIDADEEKEFAKIDADFGHENEDVRYSIGKGLQIFYANLRGAANNQAAVALVTSVQHWATKFANRISSGRERGLAKTLRILNTKLGNAPVPVDFFEKLVTVRDSVIHADSQSSWVHRGETRTVAPEYVSDSGETGISETQLAEAVTKAIEQVEWYDKKLQEYLRPKG